MRFLFRKRPVRDEALVWLARLKRGLRQSEGTALLTWLKRRSHRLAIAKAAVEWHGPEVLVVLSEIFPIPPAILEPRRGVRPVFLVAAALIGTCVTLTAPIAVLLALDLHRHFYTTAPGVTRLLTLEDGTHVELNRGTAISVVYADHIRSVEIVRGEALISVATVSRYPFYIHAMGQAFETQSAIVDVRLAAEPIECHCGPGYCHGARRTSACDRQGSTGSARAAPDAGDRARRGGRRGVRRGPHAAGPARATRLAERYLSSALRHTVVGEVRQLLRYKREVRRFTDCKADLQLKHILRNGALVA